MAMIGIGCTPAGTSSDYTFEAAAADVITKLQVTKDSHVFGVREALANGRVYSLKPEFGDALTIQPDTTTYFFLIDDAPDALFGHPMRYAFAQAGKVWSEPEQWPPTAEGVDWKWEKDITVQGVSITVLSVTAKPAARVPQPSARFVPPVELFDAGNLPNALGIKTAHAQASGQKLAVVVDGGEWDRPWLNAWQKAVLGKPFPELIAGNADQMQQALRTEQYATYRLSGLKKGGPDTTEGKLRDTIKDVTARARAGDQLVFYFNGHGYDRGIVLCSQGKVCSKLSYDNLANMFTDLPTDAKVDVILDTCYSAAAIEAFAARAPAGVQVYAAAGKGVYTYAVGQMNFTHLWLEAQDENGDGTITSTERMRHVQKRNPRVGAMMTHGTGKPADISANVTSSGDCTVGQPVKQGLRITFEVSCPEK